MEIGFKQTHLPKSISIGQNEGRIIILLDVTPCNLLDTYRHSKYPAASMIIHFDGGKSNIF
jgi:hypothetical protein